MQENYKKEAALFKMFSDENRLKILEVLKGGEACARSLLEELQISQSTLSHHMKLLCDSGIVVGRKAGKWTYYSICPRAAERAMEQLNELVPLSQHPKM